jgi:hypothetical protein
MACVAALYLFLRACVISRAGLAAENLALRQQLRVLEHAVRSHLSLERNAPIPRPVHAPSEGNVVAVPHVGGLHRGYRRVA